MICAQATGNFRFWYDDQRWEWSDKVAAIHGYAPGSMTPTTELLPSHKHPEDRDHVESVHNHEPFCSRPDSIQHAFDLFGE
jgi:hypothetical protein